MKPNKLVLVKLLMIQCLSVLSAARNPDFFYFIQKWPGSLINTNQKYCYPTGGKPAADFSIAGLQPYYIDGSFPSNCTPNIPYNRSKWLDLLYFGSQVFTIGFSEAILPPAPGVLGSLLKPVRRDSVVFGTGIMLDLISRMQKSWPSLSCPSSNGFSLWSREWKQHGTCSQSALDQHGYFKSALDLKDKLKLLQILRNTGIKPDGKVYSTGSILDAVRAETGYEPGLKCNADASGRIQLSQVYICVDTTASRVIECPGLPNSGCTSSIKFATF